MSLIKKFDYRWNMGGDPVRLHRSELSLPSPDWEIPSDSWTPGGGIGKPTGPIIGS